MLAGNRPLADEIPFLGNRLLYDMVGECARNFCFGLGFLGFGVGCLGHPALLSAPVTLTLALSRLAGEGIRRAPFSSSTLGFPLSRE